MKIEEDVVYKNEYLLEEIKKLEEELKFARSDIETLKNVIVKMCYDKYGE